MSVLHFRNPSWPSPPSRPPRNACALAPPRLPPPAPRTPPLVLGESDLSQVPQAEWVEDIDDNYTITWRNTQTGEVRSEAEHEAALAAEAGGGGGDYDYTEGDGWAEGGGDGGGGGGDGEWQELYDENGYQYWYNASTGESQYAETAET